MLALNVLKLKRDGLLTVGSCLPVTWSINGNNHSSARVKVDANAITVNYSFNRQSGAKHTVSQKIMLTTTPCHYGNERIWLSCPYCSRRVAIVYLGDQVACRKCHNLNYSSQRETDNDRALRRLHRVQDKLSADTYSVFESVPERPKHMKKEKYNRLWLEHVRARVSAIEALGAAIERI